MSYKIEEIEGIGPTSAEKLVAAGIKNTGDLLNLCRDSKGRKSTYKRTGPSEKQPLCCVNKADLMRIFGVGEEYSDLLEAAGVDTAKEPRDRRADNLAAKMAEINQQKKLTRRAPSEKQVAECVEQAKSMEGMITH